MTGHVIEYIWPHDPDGYRACLRELADGKARELAEIHRVAQLHGGIPVLAPSPTPHAVPVPSPAPRRARRERVVTLPALLAAVAIWAALWVTLGAWFGWWLAGVLG